VVVTAPLCCGGGAGRGTDACHIGCACARCPYFCRTVCAPAGSAAQALFGTSALGRERQISTCCRVEAWWRGTRLGGVLTSECTAHSGPSLLWQCREAAAPSIDAWWEDPGYSPCELASGCTAGCGNAAAAAPQGSPDRHRPSAHSRAEGEIVHNSGMWSVRH